VVEEVTAGDGAYRTYPGWVLWVGIGLCWLGIIGVVIYRIFGGLG
jgi:hypothetical protein